MLNKAIELANRAHAGQVDLAGEPYILHPLRVMMTREKEIERICAVLHDVVEDSNISFDDLRKEGFSEEVIKALDCLTKRPGESYNEFIDRVVGNDIACQIKKADLCDNLNLSRIKNPTEKDRERIKKYNYALDRINDALSLSKSLKDNWVIEINDCVSIQNFINHDDFLNSFIDFVEAHG